MVAVGLAKALKHSPNPIPTQRRPKVAPTRCTTMREAPLKHMGLGVRQLDSFVGTASESARLWALTNLNGHACMGGVCTDGRGRIDRLIDLGATIEARARVLGGAPWAAKSGGKVDLVLSLARVLLGEKPITSLRVLGGGKCKSREVGLACEADNWGQIAKMAWFAEGVIPMDLSMPLHHVSRPVMHVWRPHAGWLRPPAFGLPRSRCGRVHGHWGLLLLLSCHRLTPVDRSTQPTARSHVTLHHADSHLK